MKNLHAATKEQVHAWRFQQQKPVNISRHEHAQLHLVGNLNVVLLESALRVVVMRHGILRTGFAEQDGVLMQSVLESLPCSLAVTDLTACPSGQLPRAIDEEILQDLERPFDLSLAPLFRFKLLHASEREHILSVVAHRIIVDSFSLDILLRETAVLYSTLLNGTTHEQLSINPPQFSDLAVHPDNLPPGEGTIPSEKYWLERMYEPLPIPELPTDAARPLEQTYATSQLTLDLDPELTRKLLAFCRVQQVDPQAVLLTTYFAWLQRMTGEDDLIVGVPFNCRRMQESEQVVGPLTNTMPIRISCSESAGFDHLLDQVRTRLSEADEHRLYPFDTLLEKVDPVRDPGRSPIYTTVFCLLQSPELRFADLHVVGVDSRKRAMTHDIAVTLRRTNDLLQLSAAYNRDLFTQESILRFIAYYEKLLLAFLDDATVDFRAVDILTARDRRVYEEMNSTEADYPKDKTISDMFCDAASRYPTHPALSFGERALTYKELDERTNQLANALIAKGMQKGDFAAIVMERSLETVVSLLAIIKAGGVYVPIDPAYPEEWIRYVLSDNNAPFLLTTRPHREQVEELLLHCPSVREVLYVDAPFDVCSTDRPQVNLLPTDLAYVIYTSGSTGRPKGTLVAHGGVVNLAVWTRDHYGSSEKDCHIQFASYSFDASVWETWSALFWGARLHMLTKEERLSVEAFADAVQRVQATAVTVLPTMFFKQLASYLSDADYQKLKTLKRIVSGGEAFPGEVARLWQRRFGLDITIGNAYGPTECTVSSTVYDIDGYIPEQQANIPIGKPLANYRLYVLNKAKQLCPINVPGELYIDSAGLAAGYLNQPIKTSEVFVPHPFSHDPDSRFYKSGDIVKLLPNGNIEYLGRQDSQVKVSGFRIEIGEIEDQFAKQPQVREVAVIAKESDGITALVAYYSTNDCRPLPLEQIRSFLGQSLPPFMIPQYVFHLERMPLTPSGKMNRKELAVREIRMTVERPAYAAPETEAQKRIAAVWESALGFERIGLHDNLFDLGGNSLKIIRILAQLKSHFPSLSVQDFYQHQTIGDLNRHLEQTTAPPRDQPGARSDSWNPQPLHERMCFPSVAHAGPVFEQPQAVLLTGATGYLGSHVLQELLEQTDAHVYCLIRPSTGLSIDDRLRETMMFYFGEEAANRLSLRVTVIQGDLGEPGLGLAPQAADELQERIEAIIHCGADVRYFGDETYFYNVNARGTTELLNLARRKPGVRFHHVSTLSIPEELALSGQLNPITGTAVNDPCIDHVYANSKLQAEQLVTSAMQEGMPVTIYRAGNLTCRSSNGRFQRNMDSNAFYRMLKAMLTLGAAPDVNCLVDLTPIDYASRALVHLVGRKETVNRMIHLCNPQQIPQTALVQHLQSFGYQITMLHTTKYKEWLFRASSQQTDETMQWIVAQLEGEGMRDSDVYFSCQETQALLSDSGIDCPKPDSLLLYNLVKYAVHLGYFPAPQHWDYLDYELLRVG